MQGNLEEAKKYGVLRHTIADVRHGRTWKEVV